jgi:hypothetical protein
MDPEQMGAAISADAPGDGDDDKGMSAEEAMKHGIIAASEAIKAMKAGDAEGLWHAVRAMNALCEADEEE